MVKYVELTAQGGGYYSVYKDGVFVSRHRADREADETAINLKLESPESEVFYTHEDYRVMAQITTAGLSLINTPDPTVPIPGALSLTQSSYIVAENQDQIVNVSRTSGAVGGVACDYALTGTSGDVSGSLSWADGDSDPKSFTVPGINVASTENGTVTLSNFRTTSGGTAPTQGTNLTATFTVQDTVVTGTPNTLTLSAQRFDGGSGSATFSGSIPLKPGQLLESNLANVALFDSSGEIGVTKSTLYPRHSDDSLKYVRIDATLSLADGVEKTDLELRLNTAPTLSGPTQRVVARDWMIEPTLICSSDANHLCSSQTSVFPVVPLTHPNMPTVWSDFLTTEFDTHDNDFPAAKNLLDYIYNGDVSAFGAGGDLAGGNATYDNASPYFFIYYMTGEIERLRDAFAVVSYRPGDFGQTHVHGDGWQYAMDDYATPDGAMTYLNDYAPDGASAGDPFSTQTPDYPFVSGDGGQATKGKQEWDSGFCTDMLLAYGLSGWDQPMMNLAALGTRGIVEWDRPASQYTARFDIRLRRTLTPMMYLLSLPMDLRYSVPNAVTESAINIRDNKTTILSQIQANVIDQPADWASNFTDGDYRKDIYGQWPGSFNGQGIHENFQHNTTRDLLHLIQLHYINDARIDGWLTSLADDVIFTHIQGPFNTTYRGGGSFYKLRYTQTDDPSSIPAWTSSTGGDYWATAQIAPILAQRDAINGTTIYNDIVDSVASKNVFTYFNDLGSAGNRMKPFGQLWGRAAMCAAFRCGVSGWYEDPADPIPSSVYYQSSFETGAVQDRNEPIDGWGVVTIDPAHALVQSEQTREGSNSIKFFIDKSLDYSSVNSSGQDKPRVNLGGTGFRFSYNVDNWVGLSVYIPSGWVDDPNNPETLVQLKQPVGGSPILAIRMNENEWQIWNRWDDQSDTDAGTTTLNEVYLASNAADKGKWTDFVLHFRLCPFPNCDGVLQIWKDGVLIVDQIGPNAYLPDPENKGPHLALNLYKFNFKDNPSLVTTRELYFDAIRFGDASSNYNSVAPGQ